MRCRLSGLAIAALLVGTPAARAQTDPSQSAPGWWLVPSLRTSGVHEDNVLFTGESKAVGSFLRVTPSFEARHRTTDHLFQAGYLFEGERYAERLRMLNNTFARQSAVAMFDGQVNSRTTVYARSRYISTPRPEDVLEETGLVAEQRRTVNYTAEAAVGRNLSPRTQGRLGYTWSFDDYGDPTPTSPTARSTVHALAASASTRRGSRTTFALEYTGKVLIGEDLTTRAVGRGVFWASTAAFRVTHNLSPRVTAVLLAGPRVYQELPSLAITGDTALRWKVSPELLASVGYRHEEGHLSVAYRQSAFTGFGAAGFINTQSIELRAGYAPVKRVRVSARPAVYRNTLVGDHAMSTRVDGAAVVDLTQWLAVEANYLYKRQERGLSLAYFGTPIPGRSKTRNSIVIGVTVRRPIRVK